MRRNTHTPALQHCSTARIAHSLAIAVLVVVEQTMIYRFWIRVYGGGNLLAIGGEITPLSVNSYH